MIRICYEKFYPRFKHVVKIGRPNNSEEKNIKRFFDQMNKIWLDDGIYKIIPENLEKII